MWNAVVEPGNAPGPPFFKVATKKKQQKKMRFTVTLPKNIDQLNCQDLNSWPSVIQRERRAIINDVNDVAKGQSSLQFKGDVVSRIRKSQRFVKKVSDMYRKFQSGVKVYGPIGSGYGTDTYGSKAGIPQNLPQSITNRKYYTRLNVPDTLNLISEMKSVGNDWLKKGYEEAYHRGFALLYVANEIAGELIERLKRTCGDVMDDNPEGGSGSSGGGSDDPEGGSGSSGGGGSAGGSGGSGGSGIKVPTQRQPKQPQMAGFKPSQGLIILGLAGVAIAIATNGKKQEE